MVPRGSPRLGHVAPHHFPIKCHMSQFDSPHLPMSECHITICHLSVRMCHVVIWRCHVIIRTIRTVQSTHLFLHVWRFKQIAISLSSDVRLNPNELHWVRDDEGYTPVRFEEIPRTFIFELNFDPWSRF
jgi:hypothetical protein